ncbi:MAG: methionine--tRNA ligase [Actinobacteria bacterium]|nr:methionine--tRNA ligase [Actinomycetota bacterium]
MSEPRAHVAGLVPGGAAGRRYFVTTSIPYANGRPHIGHAYEMIAADAMARYKRLRGVPTLLLGGLDENSQNVAKEAAKEGLAPQAYVDRMADVFLATWRSLDVEFDEFVRTTQPRHHAATTELYQRIEAAGDIYRGAYEGWYCVSCERYYAADELVDGLCPSHRTKPDWIQEDNYFFRLSKYQQPLLDLYARAPDFIVPEARRNEVVSFVAQGLKDLSISRASVQWGIPVPNDPTQTIYVWFDAVINYITGVGFGPAGADGRFAAWWPAQAHVVGKDIIRFHAVYWPAMLMAGGVPLPEQIVTHGWVNFGGEKLSKSRGHVVYPREVIDLYGADALRYHLLREVPFDRDGDFTWESMARRYQADLGNDLGNLVLRTTSMVGRYLAGQAPPAGAGGALEDELRAAAATAWDDVERSVEGWRFHQALSAIWEFVTAVNRYIDRTEPWRLAKAPAPRARLQTVLATSLEAVRQIAMLIRPVMPPTSDAMHQHLGLVPPGPGEWEAARSWTGVPAGHRVPGGPALFPRVETKTPA